MWEIVFDMFVFVLFINRIRSLLNQQPHNKIRPSLCQKLRNWSKLEYCRETQRRLCALGSMHIWRILIPPLKRNMIWHSCAISNYRRLYHGLPTSAPGPRAPDPSVLTRRWRLAQRTEIRISCPAASRHKVSTTGQMSQLLSTSSNLQS